MIRWLLGFLLLAGSAFAQPSVSTTPQMMVGIAQGGSNGQYNGVAARGLYATTAVSPTVQNAAYASGNDMGGLLTFSNAIPVASAGGLIQAASARFASGGTASFDLVLFNANPSGSTITDKAAIAVATADLSKVIGVLHISDCTLLAASTESLCQITGAGLPFGTAAATTLYGALVARGAITPGSTSDLTVDIRVIQ